jgi:hypothetical protein
MPHGKPEDLPAGGGGRWPATAKSFRSVQWGDMEVGYTTQVAALDCSDVNRLAGLPGGLCPCPHYGYVFEGSIEASWPGTEMPDEVAQAGEVYFFPAGHFLRYPGPTRHLEFNPAFALQQCMDGMQRVADRYGTPAR